MMSNVDMFLLLLLFFFFSFPCFTPILSIFYVYFHLYLHLDCVVSSTVLRVRTRMAEIPTRLRIQHSKRNDRIGGNIISKMN